MRCIIIGISTTQTRNETKSSRTMVEKSNKYNEE
jgi:hypothetical protein